MKKVNKLLLSILVIFILSLWGEITFALELSWPDIPGLPKEMDSIEGFTAYAYGLIVSVGSFIAVGVLVWAGIDFITSHDVSRIKTKVIGALIGLVVLLIPYSLLITLNPEILNTTVKKLSCENLRVCIVREVKTLNSENAEVKTYVESTIQSQPNINKEGESETITIKRYHGLQNLYKSYSPNYQGGIIEIYSDNPDNDNLNLLVSGLTISNARSFKIIDKKEGVFFYDTEAYNSARDFPLFTDTGFSSFDAKKINSIDIINASKDKGIDHVGLLFNKNDYKQNCAPFFKDVPSISSDPLLGKVNFFSGEGSVKIFKRDRNKLKGSKIVLTLYNNTSCASRGSENLDSKDLIMNENKKCEIILIENEGNIGKAPDEEVKPECDKDNYNCKVTLKSLETIISPQIIEDACPNFAPNLYNQGLGEDILSFRIDSTAAIVMLNKYDICSMWDIKRISRGEGDCNQVNSQALNPNADFRAKKFYVIPY
ncbi:pilin [bacterium]|nr:pilin [bacterium]